MTVALRAPDPEAVAQAGERLCARLERDADFGPVEDWTPVDVMRWGGMEPDPWQVEFLLSPSKRRLLNCARQAGKTQAFAALALHTAVWTPRRKVLVVAQRLDSAKELMTDKLGPLYVALKGLGDLPARRTNDGVEEYRFSNGSRIVALPSSEGGIRGYSGVHLLILDEGSRIPDPLYRAVRPMLARSGGILVAGSTPFGKRGWFHHSWTQEDSWARWCITADQVPHYEPGFLEEERLALPEAWFAQEYFCEFRETEDCVFRHELVLAATRSSDEEEPDWLREVDTF